MYGLKMLATAMKLPSKEVSNDDLEKVLDTDDEWITNRTGIKTRFWCQGDESCTSLAIDACRQALNGFKPEDISLIVSSSISEDYRFPNIASLVSEEFDIKCPAFSVNAACSGFIYSLAVAYNMLDIGQKALVIGAEQLSKIVDIRDRGTAILFGDGAGAVVVEKTAGKLYYHLDAKGDSKMLECGNVNGEARYLTMLGRDVFRFAVDAIPRTIDMVLGFAGLKHEDIDLYLCHQANKRIIDHVYKKLDIDSCKFPINLDKYGNTSSASVPMLLAELNKMGRLEKGMKLMLVGFGAGLTNAGVLIEW